MTRSELNALATGRQELYQRVLRDGADPAALCQLLDLHARLVRLASCRAPAVVAREVFGPFNPERALGAEAVRA